MPPHDLFQTLLHRSQVHARSQSYCQRTVVVRVLRLQLVQKPQPLLRIRQLQLPFSTLPLPNPYNLLPSAYRNLFPTAAFDLLRQLRHRRLLEQLPQRQLHPQPFPDPRHHLGGQQRMSPQIEEVVVHSHPLQPQHFSPDLRQQFFQCCSWRVFLLKRQRGASGVFQQRLPIYVSVSIRWHFHELHNFIVLVLKSSAHLLPNRGLAFGASGGASEVNGHTAQGIDFVHDVAADPRNLFFEARDQMWFALRQAREQELHCFARRE